MENQSLGYYLNQLSLKRLEDILEINESGKAFLPATKGNKGCEIYEKIE